MNQNSIKNDERIIVERKYRELFERSEKLREKMRRNMCVCVCVGSV
jgi:antitoxin component of MazEF toxin-antitoxin module